MTDVDESDIGTQQDGLISWMASTVREHWTFQLKAMVYAVKRWWPISFIGFWALVGARVSSYESVAAICAGFALAWVCTIAFFALDAASNGGVIDVR